uniref:Uncharacterized protein n=1 Tax=Ascaris lumbricoides TaxID=6252 RepID=A0A0M3ILT4_ASCLU
MEEIDVSCDEDSISLADTLPPNLPSDRDSDSPLSERRCDSSFGNDNEEDLNLHLELSQPLSTPQSRSFNSTTHSHVPRIGLTLFLVHKISQSV